ncbi:MAG: hypothetical protein QM820_31835 [Minicystis sp.]
MRFSLGFGAAALAAGVALTGCQEAGTKYPPPSSCEGSMCGGTPPGGGVTGQDGGQGGGGTGGAGATIDQSGTVHRVVSPSFDDTVATPYGEAATIVFLPDSGTSTSASYGGGAGTTFSFTQIPSGRAWFFVQDDTAGAAQVLSTFSYWQLPVLGTFSLPVIDLGTMQSIAANLPTVAAKGGVLTNGAQIILKVVHATLPYKGVQVTGGSGGAQVAYDSGSGYSDTALATGAQGTIILFNSGLAGPSSITLTDTSTQMSYGVEVQASPGGATILGVEIP